MQPLVNNDWYITHLPLLAAINWKRSYWIQLLYILGFRELYENEQLFDITLSVDGKEFQGHKSLLAASGDYFKAMFTTHLAEKDQKVHISVNTQFYLYIFVHLKHTWKLVYSFYSLHKRFA